MTVITGPVIPEQKLSALSSANENNSISETLSALHNSEKNKSAPSETAPQAEQNEKEIPCFTAPAPVRRRRMPYFGTILAQLFIAAAAGGILWLGLNFGGETIGSAVRSALAFLLNG